MLYDWLASRLKLPVMLGLCEKLRVTLTDRTPLGLTVELLLTRAVRLRLRLGSKLNVSLALGLFVQVPDEV